MVAPVLGGRLGLGSHRKAVRLALVWLLCEPESPLRRMSAARSSTCAQSPLMMPPDFSCPPAERFVLAARLARRPRPWWTSAQGLGRRRAPLVVTPDEE